MLFLQFVQYSLSFTGTLKNEIPGAALELCQLKIKQFSPDILKFSTKHEENPFTLNCFMVPRTFCWYFMQARVDWVLIIFGTQVIKKKRLVRGFPVFPGYLSVSYDYVFILRHTLLQLFHKHWIYFSFFIFWQAPIYPSFRMPRYWH